MSGATDIDEDVLNNLCPNSSFDEYNLLSHEELEANLINSLIGDDDEQEESIKICLSVSTKDCKPDKKDIKVEVEPNCQSHAESESSEIAEMYVEEVIDSGKIKMEFTSEPEQIIHQVCGEVYFLDDSEKECNNSCDSAQIEISSASEIDNSDSQKDENDLVSVLLEEMQCRPANEFPSNVEDNLELLSIMSDHNYTSQERVTPNGSLRQHLTDYIAKRMRVSTNKEISDFVDKTIDNINTFEIDSKECDKDVESKPDKISQTNETILDTSEPSVPPETNIKNELPTVATTDADNIGKEMHEIEFSSLNMSPPLSPQETCSEPLEHTQFDEAFDINCKEKVVEVPQLQKLMIFANELRKDCETFASSTTAIENKLQKYLHDQLEAFRTIVTISNLYSCVEKSVQTEKVLSKRKFKKLNKNNKEILLNTTDSSSSFSDSSQMKSKISTQQKSLSSVSGECSMPRVCVATEYDDGVPLIEYTQSEIFETELSDNSQSRRRMYAKGSYSDDSDSDEYLQKLTSNSFSTDRKQLQNESDKENVSSKSTSCTNTTSNSRDEADKQIERLINLKALSKRPTHSALKSTDSADRAKGNIQVPKNKSQYTIFDDDDTQQEIDSDNSISENDEEEITEKQYLKRLNENIKRGLLSDSSSDCTESDRSNHIVESFSNNERSNSPLVERFLKKFNATESDDESEVCSEPGGVQASSENYENQKSTDVKNIKKISPDNSDCEVLDDGHERHKSNKSKSLEKMISDVEKRKKMNKLCGDLISLSSESESSDVEAVEDAKSRIIKPMLRPDQLASETRKAQREEADRIRRLEKKQKMLAKAIKEHPEAQSSSGLILDYNEETKTFIKVHLDIMKHLKPHQIEGVKFMFDSCYGGLESLKKQSGSGCILAHCMGLGKTLQLIALLHTVITYKELKTSKILVLCPKSTVMNWADEIKRWLGQQAPTYYTFNDTSDINDKLSILQEWSVSSAKTSGILLIGYEAFRTLVFYHSYKNRGIAPSRLESIRNDVEKYLLNPGADLVVCDEGHIIKNSKSAISLAVSQIKTPKRIILTGTPIQNNLKEYYSMVNFIKPLFLGTEKEFANLYANPIKNGQHKDSSKRDIKVMKQRSFVLHKKLSKFVQRKEAELLKTFLPKKYEYVLFIPMTTVQNTLYEHILSTISKREENRGKSLITDYTCLRKIWTHPKVLEDAWKNATNQRLKRDPRKSQVVHSDDDQPDDIYDSQTGVMSVTNDWWRSLLSDKDLETLLPSNKLRTMFEILRMCEEKGEKCLIFSAFVAVLNVVEYFFKKINSSDLETRNGLNISESHQVRNTWALGKDYYRLDGKTPKLMRHEMVESFNNLANKRARVFLISARAGGQGINLIGANRVIILDTSWNPSNDQQNIFRIFRLGQKKNCYIYRLLAMGTMEEKVYSRSVTKQAMSFRVVDEQQIDRHYNMAELGELYCLTIPNYEERQLPECPQDSILASLLYKYPHLVFKYHEHDSLLENKVEQELSEQEKADAWAAYERDLQLNSENREIPPIDDLQNNFLPAKFPNYATPPIPGFDMSSFFNYGSFGNQPAFSPFLQPMLPQCNYPAANQSYLDLYKRLAQNTFPFPDMGSSLASTAFHPPFAHNSPKSITANPPLIPELNGKSMHSSPLSALGDLSMYGIGASSKNLPPNTNATNLTQRQHSTATYAASPPSPSMLSFDQYKQTLENSLKSLGEYRKDYRLTMPNMNKAKAPVNVNQFQNPFFTSPTSLNCSHESNMNSTINISSPNNLDLQQNKQTEKSHSSKSTENIPFNISNKNDNTLNINKINTSISTTNASVPQNMSKRSFASDVISISAAANRLEENPLTPREFVNAQPNSIENNGNIGLLYSNKKIHGKSINEQLKSTDEMQIIPTSSAVGTGNAAKQFNEISPSISLTAINSINDKNTSLSNSQTQNMKIKNKTNNNQSNTNHNINDLSLGSLSTKKSMDTNNHKTINRAISVTPSTSATNPTVKTVTTAAGTAQNTYHQGPSLVEHSYLPSTNTKGGNITKKPQILTTQVQNSVGRNLTTLTTSKSLNAFQSTNVQPTSTQQISKSSARKNVNLVEKRSSPITAIAGSSNAQIQKRVNTSTLSPISPLMKESALATGKNVLNIRPVDKKSPSKSGVYIIETNINQKKFAIGVPTKSGGGTTVTKVPLQRKRKLADDPIVKEIASNESKRVK